MIDKVATGLCHKWGDKICRVDLGIVPETAAMNVGMVAPTAASNLVRYGNQQQS